MRGSSGRPRKTNEELALTGSRNIKVDQIESEELRNPHMPPERLSESGKKVWAETVPPMIANGTAKEADRGLICLYCHSVARFHDESINSETKEPSVSDTEKRNLAKTILDIADRFGMSPLSRARSGVNKKQSGIKQRPG